MSLMPRRPLSRPWTDEDLVKLKQLAESGATRMRAAAALNRASSSVVKKARELGFELPGVRAVRAGLRDADALDSGPEPERT